MHHRVLQVSKLPIPPVEYANEGYLDYDHWFTHSIADGIYADDDRAGTVRWFLESLDCAKDLVTVSDNSFLLHEGFLEAYYANRYERFIQIAADLQGVSLEDFAMGKASLDVHALGQLEEDDYAFYVIDQESDELVTLDNFLRNAEVDVWYHIGGTIYYKR